MKVWIAMDKDENELLGIFDSKKKAQDAIEKRARWQWDEMEEEDEPFGTCTNVSSKSNTKVYGFVGGNGIKLFELLLFIIERFFDDN